MPAGVVSGEVIGHVHRLYGAQSHRIDGARAREWAATFTPDGEFWSPSYPEPAVGTAALVAFAERFADADEQAGTRTRHVITNLDVEPEDGDALVVRGYLQIVVTEAGGASRLARMTTFTDDLVLLDEQWRIRRRVVRRDDEPRRSL
ncbi:nuclear transport factor 2 family protein [Saccharopolyspora sp. NFXS83]|uniref:nuclear transport factor 2 family protein n=1 Tax=Saccharopolyspora sp. NFXS83 TaxID=2993560 RepID=UPI00224A9021|nr:nuclear transport factor 2 family protein [Saccharopolyspora sp. NFXS83]MCX2730551.1 nuclear transport factor 2 family protein [Saccharopolyspora sp. NFXS83]